MREFFLLLLLSQNMFHKSVEARSTLLLDPANAFKGGFSDSDLACFFGQISQTPEKLAVKLMAEPRQSWAFDFTPLRRRPLLEVFPGKYSCPDLALLYRFFTDGIHAMLAEAYPRGTFQQLFGHIFARYIERLIEQFTYTGAAIARTFYPSPKFRGTKDEVCDGLVHWVDTALVMEYKAGMLTTRQKYAGKQLEMLTGIRGLIAMDKEGAKKGTGQLAESLRRILAGEVIAHGNAIVDLTACKKIVPVIVTYDEALGVHAVRNIADRSLRQRLKDLQVDDRRIGPLLVLTTADIEALDDVQNSVGIEKLLLDYAEHVVKSPNLLGNLHSFVHNQYPIRPTGKTLVECTVQHVLADALAELQKRAADSNLPNSQPAGTTDTVLPNVNEDEANG